MNESELTEAHLPCPNCGSSDAYALYSDGHGFCFSCNTYRKGESIELDEGYSYQYTSMRGITEATMRFYGVLTKVSGEGKPLAVAFPYGEDAQKVRSLERKEFHSVGNMKDATLFGMERFSPGQGRTITITEGEFDALAAYQMFGSKYPVVSVRSSATAAKDCEKARDFINSFDKIYLAFDNDKPGQDAVRAVANLFDPNKVFHVKFSDRFKDANAYLESKAEQEFVKCWFNARPYMPKDIIATWEQSDEILNSTDAPTIGRYPFPRLDEMAYGIRSGELILFKAPEKVGKTEVLRAIEYHLLKTTDLNMGIIHLEEQEKRSIQGIAGYELNCPAHLPDAGVSISDISNAWRSATQRDGRCHLYSHFGSDDPDVILDVIRYLVAVRRCKVIFLDHITMLVTGYEDDDERRKLDYISTRLAMMTRELNFTLFLVSHVNDDGKTRGSRNIAKVADLIINLHRDIEAPDSESRNKTFITVQGNRFAGLTGPAGILRFNSETFKLDEMEIVLNAEGGSIREFTEGAGVPHTAVGEFKIPL